MGPVEQRVATAGWMHRGFYAENVVADPDDERSHSAIFRASTGTLNFGFGSMPASICVVRT